MNGIVQLRGLGDPMNGGFGNQLTSYMFARLYADSIRAELQVPQWIGRSMFENLDDPVPTMNLASLKREELPDGRTNINLNGIFLSMPARRTWTRADARRIYRIKPELLNRTYRIPVAAHLRRGDTCQMSCGYQVIPKHCYEHAIQARGYSLDDVTWVSDGHPGVRLFPDDKMIRDFVTLVQADVLFCSVLSTFSWWAAMLGTNQKVYVGLAKVLRWWISPRRKFKSVRFVPIETTAARLE